MMIDFTNAMPDKSSHYEGSDQKRGIIWQSKRYMLKFADRISYDNNPLATSYSNSVFSEHICCKILKDMGFDVQNTLLGIARGKDRHGEEKITPVVACENFVPEGYELVEFKKIANSILMDKVGKIPKIEDIYDVLGKKNIFFDTQSILDAALKRYWDTFVIDALLGNFDRHGNNWGYLVSKNTGKLFLAPIYDCGSCLYPQLSDDVLTQILNSEKEINTRIDKFPTAALLVNEEKVNYKDYLLTTNNTDLLNALIRVYPKINLSNIAHIIEETEEISDIRKQFYKTMICARYDKIIEPAFERAKTLLYEQINDRDLQDPHQTEIEIPLNEDSTEDETHNL